MSNLIIAINEFKMSLVQLVNEASRNGVPFAVIEPIVREIMAQIQGAARDELKQARLYQNAENGEN